ncbi:MAG TPA: ABC transporter substrate-binding protein, partial [Acidimicrobiia bacterium]|nr:ABC transporter substrate-binding protein [Acidimicrobiia bacterium]
MRFVARAIAVALATSLLLTGCSSSRSGRDSGALKVGVMLPLTGPDARGSREPLDWAVENVNAAGGAAGRKLELDYADLGATTVDAATRRFAADPSIVAVIGPDTSDRFFKVAPALIEAQKTIVSPTATSGDIFRAFSSSGYVWRTVQSDIAQVRTALLLLARDGFHRPAIVTGVDHYSATFYDWFGFYANELELQPAALERYDQATQDCTASVNKALASKPDALLAAAKDEANAVCIAKAWRAKGSPGRLLFTDAAEVPALITDLGAQADGLEGIGLSEDPTSGFAKAYTERFGHAPHDAAASTYDAVALLAYGLQRSNGAGGEALNKALADVADARGAATSWDGAGIGNALDAITRGELPNVSGAAGPLTFDAFTHTDVISSTYVHWAVESGKFTAIDVLPSGSARPGVSDARVTALESLEQNYRTHGGRAYTPPVAKKGLWAVLIATSYGWENYRHQADVFAQYQALRAAGVPRGRIIVIAEDDLADNPKNPQSGRVPYEPDGDDVRAGVPIDYPLDAINADAFLAILSGRRSPSLPKVVDSSAADNVY